MSLLKFDALTQLFGSSDNESNQRELLKEVLLMVLARATSADTNVHPDEVSQVQNILAEVTGEQFSAGEIRTAAHSEIFERRSLDRYLSRATRRLDEDDRILILQCLIQVLRSDDHLREFEIDYFDRVAQALRATPAEIAGLRAGPGN